MDFNVTNTTMILVTTSDQQSLVVKGITILEDTLIEGDETFDLLFTLPSPPDRVNLGIPQATVIIMDDEGAQYKHE